jgi:hypothetical protein
MAKDAIHLSSNEALAYLKERHGIDRSMPTMHRWTASGELVPDRYSGKFKEFRPSSLDVFAAKHTRSNNLTAGIPVPDNETTRNDMSKQNLTTKKFGAGGKAGATDTEKRRTGGDFTGGGKGKDQRMFSDQKATVKTAGRVGPREVRGRGEQFATAGGSTPRGKSKVGISAPAAPSVTARGHSAA